MTDQAQTARADLAFMKAVVDDRGPLPALLGAHLLNVGVVYAPNLLWVWWIFAHNPEFPRNLIPFTWVPGTVLWLPGYLLINRFAPRTGYGPSTMVFAAAWSANGLMTAAVIGVLLAAQVTSGVAFTKLWPALAFVLYGGAWSVVAITRRRLWLGLVAGGSLLTAVVCGALVGTPHIWLVMTIGLLAFFAAPGYAIVRMAPKTDAAGG